MAISPMRAVAPRITVKPKAAAPQVVVVPGEKLRTGLCLSSLVMSPLVQATQTVGMLERATFANPLLAGAAGAVVRGAGFLARVPLINNPITRGALTAAGRLLPIVNVGILAFDGYAAYQTLTNKDASGMRKALVGARFAANALATALCFIPGNGAVLAMAPAWASIGLDLYIKRLNAQGRA
ncbi:MAG: hypothetical protein JWM80_6725 [Cyanobacteria bacterium RYN_339]|nr:hypothetical protein [Cyanobacteria bacterium RYN_339]